MNRRTQAILVLLLAIALTAWGCNSGGGSGGGGGFAPAGRIAAVAEMSGSETVVVGGTAGTTSPGTAVTITNLANSETRQVSASSDGGFEAVFNTPTSAAFRVEIPADGVDETIGVTLLRDAVDRDLSALGSVPADIGILDGRAYVVNGFSDNIQVFDITTFPPVQVGTIVLPQGQNPGAITFIDNSRAAVPNSIGQSIAIVNLQTLACETMVANDPGDFSPCTDAVVIPGAFEDPSGIASASGKLWITNNNLGPDFNPIGNGFITVIDLDSLALDAFVPATGTNPGSPMVINGRVWVLNSGNILFDLTTFTFSCDPARPPSVDVINPLSATVETTIPIPLSVANPTVCLPGALAPTPDGQSAYLGLGLVGALLKIDVPSRTLVRGPDNPVILTDLADLNLSADIVIRPDGLGFVSLFNTDQIAVFDTSNDVVNPFPFISPFPGGLAADDPASLLFSGVQSLALAPTGQFPDIFYITGLSQQLSSIDTSLVLAP